MPQAVVNMKVKIFLLTMVVNWKWVALNCGTHHIQTVGTHRNIENGEVIKRSKNGLNKTDLESRMW